MYFQNVSEKNFFNNRTAHYLLVGYHALSLREQGTSGREGSGHFFGWGEGSYDFQEERKRNGGETVVTNNRGHHRQSTA